MSANEELPNVSENFSNLTGFMTALAAIRDAADTDKKISYKEASALISTAVLKHPSVFLKGFSEACLIAIHEKTNLDTNLKWLATLQTKPEV